MSSAESAFGGLAGLNLVICLTLGYLTRSKLDKGTPETFTNHLTRYLVAWTLCIAGEWLGGPGVYALYSSYGFENQAIANLFVLGFAWSSVMGLFAGKFADRCGRKRSAMLFCAIGILTVVLKHFAWWPALMVARFFDGCHASLLYTTFESWLCSEHFQRHKFAPALLGHSFSMMFTISYLTAIACGFLAQIGKNSIPAMPPIGTMHLGGWLVPFEASALFQLAGLIYIAFNWDENYGDAAEESQNSEAPSKTLFESATTAKSLLCGIVVTFFESSMFIFVFSWTPALSPASDHAALPAGLIFATYMMACMSGASIYRLCSAQPVVNIMLGVFVTASAALSVPALGGITEETKLQNFIAFLLFEFCVGMYFPAAASMKGEFVEEGHRVTVYNMFRTPMNAIVVLVLLCGLHLETTFRLLFSQLVLGAVALAAYIFSERRRVAQLEEPLLAVIA